MMYYLSGSHEQYCRYSNIRDFDGSLNNSLAIGRFILRYSMGKLIKAEAIYYKHTSIHVVQVGAVGDRISLAIQVGFNKIILKAIMKL